MSQEILYLIDGSGFIFRAFHALPPLTRADGVPVGALYGFCNMLLKLLQTSNGKKLLVVFDKSRKTFRQDIYPLYKSHRPETPPELIPQFPLFREACQAFSVPIVEIDNFEADDIIATYVNNARGKNYKVVIVSSDKDLMQLVDSPKITMLDPIKNKIIDNEAVIEKFGVLPNKVIEVQALSGDTSDNIPGVPSIGIKTAAALIQEFNDLENLYENLAKIPQNKRRQALTENRENAFISKQLVTLRNDVPLPMELMEIAPMVAVPSKLTDFLTAQGFKKILQRITDSSTVRETINNTKYFTLTDIAVLQQWLDTAKTNGKIAIDCETTALDVHQAELVGLALAIDNNTAGYVPLTHKKEGVVLAGQIDFTTCLNLMAPILSDPKILKIGHNLKYDLAVLAKYNLPVQNICDSMLISYCLDAGKNNHNLDELANIHLNHQNITFKEVIGKNKTFDQVDVASATSYAAEDAAITWQLQEKLLPQLSPPQAKIYYDIELPLIKVIITMEKNGIAVNSDYLKIVGEEFNQRLNNLVEEIYKLAGEEFNIASPKQLGDILFNKLQLPDGGKTKTGAFVTDSEVLEKLAYQGHILPEKILLWRGLAKLQSTYVDGLLEAINPVTKRVHTCFSMVGTTTGRLSSSNPNLQNIPIKTEDGRKIRQAFIAKEGCKLVSLDYSQIELRLLAHFADVPNLQAAFANGDDIHQITASDLFNVDLSSVTSEQRRRAKIINFGILYGISPFGLAKQLSISNADATKIIQLYLSRYPGIEGYMQQCRKTARERGYVETLLQRRCYVPGINNKNVMIRQAAERQAINAPLQGSNADIIKMAMIKIDDFLQPHQTKMVLQVHDELLFEIPLAEINLVSNIRNIMENIVQLKIPLKVDGGIGNNWNELQQI